MTRWHLVLVVGLAAILMGQDYNVPFRPQAAAGGAGKDFTSLAQACWLVQNQSGLDECTSSETNNAVEYDNAGTPPALALVYNHDATNDINYVTTINGFPYGYLQVADTAAMRVCAPPGTNDGACTVAFFVRYSGGADFFVDKDTSRGAPANGGFYIYDAGSSFQAYLDGTGEGSAGDPGDGSWHHIGFTWDDSGDNLLTTYYDGATTCTGGCATAADKSATDTDPFNIGLNTGADIGSVAVFNYKLSTAEMCSLCRTGVDGTDTDRSTLCGSCTAASP